jgi:hypothetical protein
MIRLDTDTARTLVRVLGANPDELTDPQLQAALTNLTAPVDWRRVRNHATARAADDATRKNPDT